MDNNTLYLQTLQPLSESNFANLVFDQSKGIVYQFYKPKTTEHMTEEDYKGELQSVLKNCLETRARGLVTDTRDFYFPIAPKLQEWTNDHIFANQIYLEKCGVIISSDLIGQLSLEQVVEEQKDGRFIMRFFPTIAEATKWICP